MSTYLFGFQLGRFCATAGVPATRSGCRVLRRVPGRGRQGHPERALEAVASLVEWCEGDRTLLARARADVLRDTRGAQAAVAENNRHAAELLELVARA
jgi:hypothetical protein